MHRILFTIGNVPIYSFGVLVALGVVAGTVMGARLARHVRMTAEQAVEALIWLIVIGVFTARLGYVLQNTGYFAAHPGELLHFRNGGMSAHGGLAGFALGTLYLARRMGLHPLDMLDLFSPGLMLGLAVGRIGCLLNGCCFGRACTLPWAVFMADEHSGVAAWRHPTPIYEMLLALAICAWLAVLLRRRTFRGQVFTAMLFLYGGARFLDEFTREGTLLPGGLTLAQYVSLALMAASSIASLYLRRRSLSGGTSLEGTAPAPHPKKGGSRR